MGVVKVLVAVASTILILAELSTPSWAQGNKDSQFREGERVFNTIAGIGCKTCHGEYAEGDVGVGPYIRGASEGAIRAAIDATDAMVVVKSVITNDEIIAVAAFVGNLGTKQAARTLAKRGRFLPSEVSIRTGTRVQLIIQNSSVQAHTFKSDNMGVDDLVVAGRSSGSLEWHAPETAGEFSLYCTDCKLKGQFFTVKVATDAAAFKQVVPVRASTDNTM